MEEKYIIYMAQKGDYDSFKVLYEKYYMKLYNYAYGKMKNKSDVEDIVQVAFLKTYKNLIYYDIDKGKFYNFIITNCKQVISDFYTKKMTRDGIAEEVRFEDKVINDVLVDYTDIGSDNYNITSTLQKLTEEQKEAFILIYIKHIKQKEAAQIMGKSVGSVKSLAFRARQVLKEEIAKNNPELGKRYGFTKYLKIAIILTVGFALIGGFAYAMFRLYKTNIQKNTFTLADVERELPDEEAEISRKEVIEIMQNDLEILGMNTDFDETKLHLKRDYIIGKNCWEYVDESCVLSIDSTSGNIIIYACMNQEKGVEKFEFDNVIKELKLVDEYELYSKEVRGEECYIEYAKKYGDLFNLYQKITIVVKNNRVVLITTIDSEYEECEINISKEEAINILKQKEIDVIEIGLSIEIVDSNRIDNYNDIYDGVEKLNEIKLVNSNFTAKKVWKAKDVNNTYYFIDSTNGDFINLSTLEYRSN